MSRKGQPVLDTRVFLGELVHIDGPCWLHRNCRPPALGVYTTLIPADTTVGQEACMCRIQ